MYQPAISDENIRRLYQMKLRERKPMTRLLDQILNDFFSSYEPEIITERKEPTWTRSDQTN